MTENECTVIQYHRRNDRTPEKDFERREETNKKLTSEVRRAVERARNIITDLQDDVDERCRLFFGLFTLFRSVSHTPIVLNLLFTFYLSVPLKKNIYCGKVLHQLCLILIQC